MNRWFTATHFGIRPMNERFIVCVFFPNSTPPTLTGLRFFWKILFSRKEDHHGWRSAQKSLNHPEPLTTAIVWEDATNIKNSHRKTVKKPTSLLKSNEFWRFLTQLRFQDEAKLPAYSSKNGPQWHARTWMRGWDNPCLMRQGLPPWVVFCVFSRKNHMRYPPES